MKFPRDIGGLRCFRTTNRIMWINYGASSSSYFRPDFRYTLGTWYHSVPALTFWNETITKGLLKSPLKLVLTTSNSDIWREEEEAFKHHSEMLISYKIICP